jgi:phage gp36-like protein
VTYATQQDLIARFGYDEIAQLSDTEGTGALDQARIDQVLADTDARIDGYLGSRYVLPLTTSPPILANLACDIARYLLAKTVPTDEMRARYEDAVKWLTSVAKGDFSLPDQAGAITWV